MNDNIQPFYLGEKTHEEDEAAPAKSGISYGGAMPEALANYKPRSNEDMKRAVKLSEKYERKSMIFRRLLYLERKQQEILGYMLDAKKRNRSLRSFLGLEKESSRQREWNEQLEELRLEHEELSAKKAELEKEIKEMEKQDNE